MSADLKRCIDCKEFKPIAEFYFNPQTRCKLYSWCKPCHAVRQRLWRQRIKHDPTKTRQRKRILDECRRKALRCQYGIDDAGYDAMLAAQQGVCAICGLPETAERYGKKFRLAVDHDHVTGLNRGLLCNNCNRGLGSFQDDPALLEKAAAYLRRHGKTY